MPPTQLDVEFFRPRPERETRIPGLARKRAPQARGLSEGTRRKPDTDDRANQTKGSLGGAIESAATDIFEFAADSAAPLSGW
jgi:hypothetical protein